MAQQWWTLGKQHMNETATANGHTLTWKRLPRPSKDHALAFEGTCTDCGATVEIGSGWSSCATIRDARNETCSGPGTAVLTEVEAARASELFAEALGEYVQALAGAGVVYTDPQAPFRFGQRVRTTVDAGGIVTVFAPAGSFGTVIYPLDKWGDLGVVLDGDSSGGIHAYGEDQLAPVADAPDWLAAHL